MKKSRLLVTGGAGFIGSHLCHSLVELGHSVVVLDDLSTGSLDNLKGLDVDFHEGSVVYAGDIKKAAKGCDGVFHLAAKVSVPESFDQKQEYANVNFLGSKNVRVCCPDAWLTLASTCAVYGGNVTEDPVVETVPHWPLSPYAETKVIAEQYADCSLRFFNVYGPKQRADSAYSGVISLFCKAAMGDGNISVYGDGEQTRDFVYVSDVVSALVLSFIKKKKMVFNVGSGKETSVNDLIRHIELVFERKLNVEHLESRDEIRKIVSNVDQINNYIGWRPRSSMNSGLKDVQKWLQNTL